MAPSPQGRSNILVNFETMGKPTISEHVLFICIAFALTGCANPVGTQFSPTTLPVRSSHRSAIERHRDRQESWMLSEAGEQNLIYVSDVLANAVYVYRASDLRLTGTLTGFSDPQGECVDAASNVWITNTTATQIVEYAHGGTTPIATLSDPGKSPVDCSVDATTGDLAVMNECPAPSCNSGVGNVIIYPKASGSGHTYFDPAISFYYFDGYDQQGNLFLDGVSKSGSFMFAELHHKTHTFTNITINRSISFPGSVQWDGTHMTTTPQTASGGSLIYRLKITGSTASVSGTTQIQPSSCGGIVWISGSKVASTCFNTSGNNTVDLWKYPTGGSALRSSPGLSAPVGVTVSVAPR